MYVYTELGSTAVQSWAVLRYRVGQYRGTFLVPLWVTSILF